MAICGYCRAMFDTEDALTEHDFAAHGRRARRASERQLWAQFMDERGDPNGWMGKAIKEIDAELSRYDERQAVVALEEKKK